MATAAHAVSAHLEALERARAGYYAADWQTALDAATATIAGAHWAGDTETEGRGWHIRSEALRQLDRYEEIGQGFELALALLAAADSVVPRAYAENDAGWYAYGQGHRGEAHALFVAALERAEAAGDLTAALTVRESLLWTRYDEGRYEEVIETTAAHAGLGADEPEPLPYVARIRTLAFLAAADDAGALDAADGYTAIASIGSRWDGVAAPLLDARARAVAGDCGALEAVPELVVAADRLTRPKGAIARAWWWAALAVVRPREACARRRELLGPAEASRDAVAQIEARAVDALLHPTLPVKLATAPGLDAPLDDLEAALYLAAYRQTGGASRLMAPLLGRDHSVVSRRLRELGLEPRPPGRPRR